jgi:hypothetical protein
MKSLSPSKVVFEKDGSRKLTNNTSNAHKSPVEP